MRALLEAKMLSSTFPYMGLEERVVLFAHPPLLHPKACYGIAENMLSHDAIVRLTAVGFLSVPS